MEIEIKRTLNSGEVVGLPGWQCNCGRIYGITQDSNYLKVQEISYIRCMLEHKGVQDARVEEQHGGCSNVKIKSLAKQMLEYDLKLTLEKKVKRCECRHMERYHHSYNFYGNKITYCNAKDCHCHNYSERKTNS